VVDRKAQTICLLTTLLVFFHFNYQAFDVVSAIRVWRFMLNLIQDSRAGQDHRSGSDNPRISKRTEQQGESIEPGPNQATDSR
jgi:hypothetical protein